MSSEIEAIRNQFLAAIVNRDGMLAIDAAGRLAEILTSIETRLAAIESASQRAEAR